MQAKTYPTPAAILELLKPITWFPPMWACACGVLASGAPLLENAVIAIVGIILAGPLVCAMSQAVNDWYDRHVDAINEPNRPIPSGRIPGAWGLYIGIGWTVLSLGVAAMLGQWVFVSAIIGAALAWAYSAPPFRLKENGWWGNAACGDSQMGVNSLPVLLGADGAAKVACAIMAAPQVLVIALVFAWGKPIQGAFIVLLLIGQLLMMAKFLKAPVEKALWYSGFGVPLFVLGMMASACAARVFTLSA